MAKYQGFRSFDVLLEELSDAERQEIADAQFALDLALFMRLARKRLDLTQQEAAQRTGFSQQEISRFERRRAGRVTVMTLQRYLRTLGYSIDIILKNEETDEVLSLGTLAHDLQATSRELVPA